MSAACTPIIFAKDLPADVKEMWSARLASYAEGLPNTTTLYWTVATAKGMITHIHRQEDPAAGGYWQHGTDRPQNSEYLGMQSARSILFEADGSTITNEFWSQTLCGQCSTLQVYAPEKDDFADETYVVYDEVIKELARQGGYTFVLQTGTEYDDFLKGAKALKKFTNKRTGNAIQYRLWEVKK